MWAVGAVLIVVTPLWIVLGAALHGAHAPVRDTGGEAWWWDSGHPPRGVHPAGTMDSRPGRAGRSHTMKRTAIALTFVVFLAPVLPASAADDSKVKAATNQVESGAKQVGQGKVGDGVENTAKGIGNTVAEGAKYTGEKLKESGKAAEPEAKSAWTNLKESANSFGGSVKNFFTKLFGS
jgi:hypothetical protein